MYDYGPLDCEWIEPAPGVWACCVCGIPFSRRIKYYKQPPRRRCARKKEHTEPCRFFGKLLRLVPCETCQGEVKIKAFACEVHGETTLAKKLDGVACCMGCRSYRPIAQCTNIAPPADARAASTTETPRIA